MTKCWKFQDNKKWNKETIHEAKYKASDKFNIMLDTKERYL